MPVSVLEARHRPVASRADPAGTDSGALLLGGADVRLPALRYAAVAAALLLATEAHATFHLMQIEQAMGGANGNAANNPNGNTSVQAVQLRMRSLGENLVSNGRLYAWSADGLTKVLLCGPTSNVTTSAAGSHVLIATAGFAAATTPAITPDFIMTNRIPDSFLAAGSLTWEDRFETIYWRVSWGAYTGPTDGDIINDADGEFGPPVAGPLPSSSFQALHFNGAVNAQSTNNLADYSITAGDATWTNNKNQSATLSPLVGVPAPQGVALALGAPSPNPAHRTIAYSVELPTESAVRVRVIDPAGRVVRTLVDGTLPAGRHPLQWSATAGDATLHTGIYFLQLEAAGQRISRRFAIVE